MLVIGLLWKNRPPKTINVLYGYRTSGSMKSKETWDFAHRYASRIWLYTGLPLGIISILLLIIFKNYDKDTLAIIVLVITFVQLIFIFLPIVPTEIALKKRFDQNGNRK
jgi:uncharacterized membrane protein